jgi:hypothetical protein
LRRFGGQRARQPDCSDAGSSQRHATVDDPGFNQCESRIFALRRELTMAIGNHPLAIMDRVDGEAGDMNLCARDINAAASFNGINVEPADPGVVQFLSPAM